MLTEIAQLEIHVIVNDELPAGTQRDGAQTEIRMDNICCAAHGISLLLIATKGDQEHQFLFDAGPEGEVWEMNSARLRAEVGRIEHVALSHYHRDHSGGLTKAIELINKHNDRGEQVVVDVHPDRPAYRGVQAGRPISLKADPSFKELEAAGGTLLKSDQPHTVLDDFFLVSGKIPREASYEDGIYGGLRFDEATKKWQEDTLIMEERYVMCNLKGKGLVVFTGCGHASFVNICHNAVKLGNGSPLYCVVGGYHLADAEDAKFNATMADLRKLEPKVLLEGHCTGWRFKCLIARDLSNCLVPCFSGSKYTL
ncbi:hypothetical protein BDV19DRAFT_381970 [Aspergillus venezuelensis]